MGTRKSVDQILDGAADILEKHGWVTENCYDSNTGGFCALGAIAKAVYPKMSNDDIGDLAYVDGRAEDGDTVDPRHLAAVHFFARRIGNPADVVRYADSVVYDFNDRFDSGIDKDYDFETGEYNLTVDEKVRYKSSQKVVQKLRNAAKAYRKQQASV